MLLNVHKHLFHALQRETGSLATGESLTTEQRCWKESRLLISAQNKALAVLLFRPKYTKSQDA